jgi:hypothetical protein
MGHFFKPFLGEGANDGSAWERWRENGFRLIFDDLTMNTNKRVSVSAA